MSAPPQETMPAIAVVPGTPHSLHATRLPRPEAGPGQVLVKVRQAGICGTDRELIESAFGMAPPGSDELVLGHELLGEVAAVGPGVSGWDPGDLVTTTVRRPCDCAPCRAGQADFCAGLRYTEYGIVARHGFMTESFVEAADQLVRVPKALAATGVLTEPLSVVEKAVQQAVLIQRRIVGWTPTTALVLGAGPIGLLGSLLLRSRGARVVTVARRPPPNAPAAILAAAGARYASLRETTLAELARGLPPIDLIVEATGSASLVFEAMEVLGNNGVLVLLSVTGGDELIPVRAAAINRGFVLGNKVMVGSVNSSRQHFELAVADLERFEALWPGLAARLITRRLDGLGAWRGILDKEADGIKTVIEVG